MNQKLLNRITPGPWKATDRRFMERPVRIQEHIAVAPDAGPTFAYLSTGRDARADVQKANALLISLAPEMLEALEDIVGMAEAGRMVHVINRAKAVLAKTKEV